MSFDPYDIMEAVDVASKVPPNFYTQMESKKWAERKEALDIIEKLTATPKIEPSDQLGDLVRILKKTITKDNNIVVATSAAKCMCQLAQGLRAHFGAHAHSTIGVIFEKFKEKKPQVVAVLRDTSDAIFVATNLEAIQEDITTNLDNKNPQIKSELCLFLARAFAQHPGKLLQNKKVIKPLVTALMKTLSDMDATVRENSAQAIGTMMKVLTPVALLPLLADVEQLKVAKIKEYCEKAEIQTGPKGGGAPGVVANGQVPAEAEAADQEAQGPDGDGDEPDIDPYDLMDAVDISNKISPSFYTQMESKKWAERKEALDTIEKLTAAPKIEPSDQLSDLVRILKKTITKDNNIVVATSAAKCMCQLAQGMRANFGPHAHGSIGVIIEKFKEKKPQVVTVLRDTADAIFVATNLEAIQEDITTNLDNKNPQIKAELCLFLARAFANHPAQLLQNKKVIKPLVTALMKTLSDMDATVRDTSAQALGTMMKALGDRVLMPLLADLEELKIKKIKEHRDKAQVKSLPRSMMAPEAKAPAAPTNTIKAPQAQQQQQQQLQQLPRQNPTPSTATFVRPKMRQKLGAVKSTGYGQQPAAPASTNGNTSSSSSVASGPTTATVKRTNTIVKHRSMLPSSAAGMTGSNANIDSLTQQMSQLSTGTTTATGKSLPKPGGGIPSRTNSGLSGRSIAGTRKPGGLPTAAKPTFSPAVLQQVNQNAISSTPTGNHQMVQQLQFSSDEYKSSPQQIQQQSQHVNNHHNTNNNSQYHHDQDPDANLDGILGRLTSQNTTQAVEAFQQLENLLCQSETQELFINRVDQVVGFCSNHLRMICETHKDARRLNPSATLSSNTAVPFVKAVSTTLIALFNSRSLAMMASQTPLSDLMKQIFTLIAICNTFSNNNNNSNKLNQNNSTASNSVANALSGSDQQNLLITSPTTAAATTTTTSTSTSGVSTATSQINNNSNSHTTCNNTSDLLLNTSLGSPGSSKFSVFNSSEDEAIVNKNLNLLAAAAIKAVDPTTMLCLLIGLLIDSLQVCVTQVQVATVELIMKGLWRMTRKIGSSFGQLDIERVLAEIHCFLEAFPPSYWKSGDRKDDRPIKTIKTLIYSITESLGNSIYKLMGTVPDHCEMRTYIKRALIQCEMERAQSPVQTLVDTS